MENQINLFRDVLAGEKRRRLVGSIVIFSLALIVLLGWLVNDLAQSEKKKIAAEMAVLDSQIKIEQKLVDDLGGELKLRQASHEKAAMGSAVASIEKIEHQNKFNQLAEVHEWLSNWPIAKTRLRSISIDQGRLVFVGEALTQGMAKNGARAASQMMAAGHVWSMAVEELKTEPGVVEFKVVGVTRHEGAK